MHNDCVTLADIERKGISKEKITAFENALKDAKITPAERTKLYQQVLSDLNTNKLTTADADRLMSEFASPNLNSKTKKFLANFTDKGSLDVWIATKYWGNRLDVLDQMANIKINTSNLKPVYNFSKTTDGFEVWQGLQPGGINWATIKEKKVTALPGGTKGRLLNNFNQVLNVYPLMKRMEYEVDERFVYKTDPNGNVSEMTDKSVEYFDKHERTERNEQEQTKNSKKKGAKTPGDAGGHIASNESNGPSEQLNYWPIDGSSNSGGAWRNMEREIIRLRTINPAANIEVIYKVRSFTGARPNSFIVSYKIGNAPTVIYGVVPN